MLFQSLTGGSNHFYNGWRCNGWGRSPLPSPPPLPCPSHEKKGRWAVALAAIQPDSLIGPTECLSGSPRVTTAAFYYSVKWGVKDRYGCSYLTMQNVSPMGRKIRGQKGKSAARMLFVRGLTAPVHRNNPVLLFTSQRKAFVSVF